MPLLAHGDSGYFSHTHLHDPVVVLLKIRGDCFLDNPFRRRGAASWQKRKWRKRRGQGTEGVFFSCTPYGAVLVTLRDGEVDLP